MVETFRERPASDTDVLDRDQAPAAAAAEQGEPPAKRPCINPATDPSPASSNPQNQDPEAEAPPPPAAAQQEEPPAKCPCIAPPVDPSPASSKSEEEGSRAAAAAEGEEPPAQRPSLYPAIDPFPASSDSEDEGQQAPAGAAAAEQQEPPAKRPCLNPGMDPFPASSDSEDEDLKVLGDSGEVPTRDYPHCRTDCAVHAFQRTVLSKKQEAPGNAQHCPQCYCYVCDKPADQCQSWGTGTSPWDHCHAYDDTKVLSQAHWRDLRMVRRNRGHDAMLARQAAAQGLPAAPAAPAAAAAGGGGRHGAGGLRTPGGVARRGRGRPPLRRSTGPDWMVQSSISRFYAPLQQQQGRDKGAAGTAGSTTAAAAAAAAGGGQGDRDRPELPTIISDSSQEDPEQQQQQEGGPGGQAAGAVTSPSRARQRHAAAEPPAAAGGDGPGAADRTDAAPDEQQQQQQQQQQQHRVASPRGSSRAAQPAAAAAAAAKAPPAPAPAASVASGAGQVAGQDLPPGYGQLGLVRVYCNYSPAEGWVGCAWASTVKMLAGERAFVWQPGEGWIAASAFEEASGKGNCRKWRDTLFMHLPSGDAAAAAAGGLDAGPEQQQPTRKECVRAGLWLDQHGVAARKRGRAGAH